MPEGNRPGYVARVITWEGTSLVNVCDEDLMGKTIGGDGVEIHISRQYFGGERVSEEQALNLVRSASIANLVGRRIVGRVLDAKLAARDAVKEVGTVQFLMIFRFAR